MFFVRTFAVLKRLGIIVSGGLALLGTPAAAAQVSLSNPAFEAPGVGRLASGFDSGNDVPGWKNTGATYVNSGVEPALQPGSAGGYVNTSGYVAFLRGSDGGAYQVTSQTLSAGQVYRLVWKAGSISGLAGTTNQRVRLFRTTDNGTTRTPLATSTAALNASNIVFETYLLNYTAVAGDAGAKIGIEIENTSTGTGIIGFDDFELEIDPTGPAPATGLPTLVWDDGSTEDGTVTFEATTAIEREYHFLLPIGPSVPKAWRTILRVSAGNADIYGASSYFPTTANYSLGSNRTSGDEGFTSSNHSEGAVHRITVRATAGTSFSLVAGAVFVTDLGPLGYTDANANGSYDIGETALPSGAVNQIVKPEGTKFFKAVAPPGVPAWSLWLNGDQRQFSLGKGKVGTDLMQPGQMLVVPSILAANETYYISVPGAPGESISLDSRIQEVSELAFHASVPNVAVSGPPYRVYRVTVPAEQIGWDTSVTAHSGNPGLSVRKNLVGSDRYNDAYSQAPGDATDSVTLVPDFLTNGTWFVTVFGAGEYNFSLRSGNPEIIPLSFNDTKINTDLKRAGSVTYCITDIPSQIGAPGWELELTNAVPGSRLMIRRNKVPGGWQSGYPASSSSSSYADSSTTGGLIQRPGHQADVYYVTVHVPQKPLEAFTLNTRPLAAQNAGSGDLSLPVAGHLPGTWRFLKFEITDLQSILGWDLRVQNPTGGTMQMVVRREAFPIEIANSGPVSTATDPWPVGKAIVPPDLDWTLRYETGHDSGNLKPYLRHIFATGAPLVAGTYYVGIYNAGYTSSTYSLLGRKIGAGQSIDVDDLAFSGGTASINDLAPREGRYFKVAVPTGVRSWEFTLAPSVGEMSMIVRRGFVPSESNDKATQSTTDGFHVRKTGAERRVILPANGQEFLVPGDYYIAVVSEGQNPPSASSIGTGSCSGVLRSVGPLAVQSLGQATTSPINQPISLEEGQIKAFTFTVPANATSLQVSMTGITGSPCLALIAGDTLPNLTVNGMYSYGWEGGKSGATARNSSIELIVPPPGVYTLVARSAQPINAELLPAGATISIAVRSPTLVAFNGGTSSVSSQTAGTWSFFQVTVPATAGIKGWDLRLRNISGTGDPRMIVRRDQIPVSTAASPWDSPWLQTSWPSGNFWGAPSSDWTGRQAETSGGFAFRSTRLVAAMGQPLEPGTYFIGVYNETGNGRNGPASYIFESRGIGVGQVIAVNDLAFTPQATAAVSNLSPREASYHRIVIPPNTPSWELDLSATSGESMMMVNAGVIPGIQGGHRMSRVGSEKFVMLPNPGQDFITTGEYYVAVVSEGQNPPSGAIGTSTSSANLSNTGALPVTDLGEISATANVSSFNLTAGSHRIYDFTIPAGVSNLELKLSNVIGAGTPRICVVAGTRPPKVSEPLTALMGTTGGQESGVRRGHPLNLISPAAGRYSLVLYGGYDSGSSGQLSILANLQPAMETLSFNGGSFAVTSQPSQRYRHFQVTVPSTSGVLGWDIRLKNLSGGGSPRIRIRRDLAPSESGTSTVDNSSSSWSSGDQWNGAERISLAMGRPLEPGTYIVSVYNSHTNLPSSYAIESCGIGASQAIPVIELGSSAVITNLSAGETLYYRMEIPPNTPSRRVTVDVTSGDPKLSVRRNVIPSTGGDDGDGTQGDSSWQKSIERPGAERLLMIPGFNQPFLISGTYFIAVTAGTGTVSGSVTIEDGPVATNLGVIDESGVSLPLSVFAGEHRNFTFQIPADSFGVEARLIGAPANTELAVTSGAVTPGGVGSSYGVDGYQAGTAKTGTSLITIDPVTAGQYTLRVFGEDGFSGNLQVKLLSRIPLNFSPAQNAGGGSNVDSRTLAAGEVVNYQVVMPPVALDALGWKFRVNVTSGSKPKFSIGGAAAVSVVAPPLFNPEGPLTLRAEATNPGSYVLTSEPIFLKQSAWTMPVGFNQTFADTGDGLGGDQGTDLAVEDWHFYAVDVPEGNSGLLRAELLAISGNPNAYLRRGAIPTTSYTTQDNKPFYERSLAESGTEYANWVPLDGKTESFLPSGRYYVGVVASGVSNARYRLNLSTGKVTDIDLVSGSAANQQIAGRDWLHYRFTVPVSAPANWQVQITQHSGSVVTRVRDSLPAGDGANSALPQSWQSDNKNQGPYAFWAGTGTLSLAAPPLRPGHTYFIGVRATTDAVFSISSGVSGGQIGPFEILDYSNGNLTQTIPAGGSLMFQIPVPSDATRLKWTSLHSLNVKLRLEQGTLPSISGGVQHYISPGTNSSFNVALSGWPWVAGQIYYLRVVNNGSSPESVTVQLDGKDRETEDEDRDGLADAWEKQRYGGITEQAALSDADKDGIPDLLEFAFDLPHLGMNPVVQGGSDLPGLPLVTCLITQNGGSMRFEFIARRRGLDYTAEISNSMANSGPDGWIACSAVPSRVPINAIWERVVIEEPITPSTLRKFGRVRVRGGASD